jgi:hypothetical protein
LSSVIYFANIDVLAGVTEDYVLDHLDVQETSAFNQNFDAFGFESQNWILLSGGLYTMIVLIFLF